MNSYRAAYAVAIVLFLVNVAILAIQAAYATGHGADLGITPQAQAWIAVLSTVIAAALGVLPQVQRTPAVRDSRYIAALAGSLPEDVARKHGLVAIQQPDGSLTVTTPDQPPPH